MKKIKWKCLVGAISIIPIILFTLWGFLWGVGRLTEIIFNFSTTMPGEIFAVGIVTTICTGIFVVMVVLLYQRCEDKWY